MIRSLVRTAALLLVAATPAVAQVHIKGAATGLSSSFVTLDFNAILLANNTVITNQAGNGVVFEHAIYGGVPQFGGAVFSTPAIYNFTALFDENENLVISFTTPVTGAAFNLMTHQGTTLFEAFLGVTKVTEFEHATDGLAQSSLLYWGFEDYEFDRIVITSSAEQGKAIGIDNLQVANQVVPEPGSMYLLGVGLGALMLAARRRRILR